MSTTVTYKGNTLTTATNQTRTLKTAGKYMEDDVVITDVTSGGSSYVSIGSDLYTVSTTSTSAASVATLTLSNASQYFRDPTKTIYIRIRDMNGARAGYFFGSDCYIIYDNNFGWVFSKNIIRYTTSSAFAVYQATGTAGYGVYVNTVSTSGLNASVRIYRRYNSTYSLTINSNYRVDVFVLSGPNNKGPFVV